MVKNWPNNVYFMSILSSPPPSSPLTTTALNMIVTHLVSSLSQGWTCLASSQSARLPSTGHLKASLFGIYSFCHIRHEQHQCMQPKRVKFLTSRKMSSRDVMLMVKPSSLPWFLPVANTPSTEDNSPSILGMSSAITYYSIKWNYLPR